MEIPGGAGAAARPSQTRRADALAAERISLCNDALVNLCRVKDAGGDTNEALDAISALSSSHVSCALGNAIWGGVKSDMFIKDGVAYMRVENMSCGSLIVQFGDTKIGLENSYATGCGVDSIFNHFQQMESERSQ